MINRLFLLGSLFLLCCIFCATASAQRLIWEVDYEGFFDNREYKASVQMPQTIFGMRLSPSIGLLIDDRYAVLAGANWIQPIGGNFKQAIFSPTIYFRYMGKKGFRYTIGAFPISQLIEQPSNLFLYDSIAYFRPNIRGAVFQYQKENGYVEFYCDWRGSQSRTEREAFRLIANGNYHPSWYSAGARLAMNHLAGYADPTEYLGVCDDVLINPYLRADLTRFVPMDSLSIETGYVVSMQRFRKYDQEYKRNGFFSEIYAKWRFLGLKNTFYAGENLMPYYPQMGAQLNQGDPFFQSPLYNRLDLMLFFVNKKMLSCYFASNIHFTPGRVDFQQQLIVRFNIRSK